MNFLKKFVAPKTSPGEILPLSEEKFDCQPSDCHFKYPNSCFSLKGLAASEPLWESSKTADIRIIVKTGKTDWGHDALNDNQTATSILPSISTYGNKLASKTNCSVTSNVSSESFDATSPHFGQYCENEMVDVLIMPWFVRINGITKLNISDIYQVLADVVKTAPKGKEGSELISKLVLDGVEVKMDHNSSFILLCSHNTRDKKCGQTAPYMKKEFESQLGDHGLHRDANDDRPDGAKVIFINHVGGHKFAANVLIHKRNGEFIWFARCSPMNVKALVEETIINGKIFPDNVRTCKKFEAIDW